MTAENIIYDIREMLDGVQCWEDDLVSLYNINYAVDVDKEVKRYNRNRKQKLDAIEYIVKVRGDGIILRIWCRNVTMKSWYEFTK